MAEASVSTSGERCAITGVLDFSSAAEVLKKVSAHLQQQSSSTINLAGVTASNSAGLAVLIECLGVAHRAGHSVRFEAMPDSLVQLARVCQVEGFLQ